MVMMRMGRIPEETIEQVATANDIVEVIGSYFPLKKVGANYRAICPFHNEKTASFYVSPQRQTFHCFGCNAGGGVFRFVMDYESLDFPSAVRRLADRVGIKIEEESFDPAEKSRAALRRRLLDLHEATAKWFHHNLMSSHAGKTARDYLKSRGLGKEAAVSWRLGYAPDSWQAFSGFAGKEGYDRETIVRSGLVSLKDESRPGGEFYDRFRHRLMFPICDDVGQVIAFSGRLLDPEAKAAKYVNSPETPLFTKGKVLFGLDKTKRPLIDAGVAIVCEGQLDLITAFENGIRNVIAPQGTAFTERQARILKRFVQEVVLCFDSDSAGQNAAERSFQALLDSELGIRVARMPPGEDPDSLIRNQGAEVFLEEIDSAKDYFDFLTDHEAAKVDLTTPKGKRAAATRLAEAASLLSDPIMRDLVVERIAARLGIGAEQFRALLRAPGKTRYVEEEGEEEPARGLEKPGSAVAQLVRLALRHPDCREWLQSQDWQELLSEVAGTEILQRVLGSELRGEDAGSLGAFMASLDSEEESLISFLLQEEIPENPDSLEDCWRDLRRQMLEQRRASAQSRLSAPGIGMEEISRLQKEILDLQEQLTDIARLSGAKGASQSPPHKENNRAGV